METIEYRLISGFPDYRVGSDGSLWSCRKWRQYRGEWHRLAGSPNHGYLCIRLWGPGGSHRETFIHRLVLESFVGPCPPGMESRHLDGNSRNCSLENLCWGTSTENKADTARHGTRARGERNGRAKLTVTEVLEIRSRYAAGEISQAALGREFGVRQSAIYAIVTGKKWRHV